MNPTLPAKLPRPEAAFDGDIDARILQVEQRLIARENRLRVGLDGLTQNLQQRLQPRHWLAPAGSVLLVTAALASLLKRPSRPAGPAVAGEAATPGAAGLLGLPWARLLGLALPLLPAPWRERISPAAASSVVALGLPLIERLLGGKQAEPLAAVAEVDLMRLSGRWFLIAELPGPLDTAPVQPPELGLLPRDDGQLDLLQRRIDRSGTHGRESLVQPVPGSHGARLRLSAWPAALQWLSWAWTDHAVLHVDEAYDEALIGSPARDSLWLLSRRPQLAHERRQALVQIARDRGFAVDRLRFAPAA